MTKNTPIEQRRLGKSGISVTKVGCGLWAQGGHWGPIDDEASLAAIDAARDEGVNFFDTADVYGDGHSESLLGRAIKGRRDDFVIATKIGWQKFDGDRGASQYDTPEKIVAGVEESLGRLGTDFIDVIQCHIFFEEPNTPIFIDGFRKLKEQGKVRAWGVSTGDLSLLKVFNADKDCDVLQIDYCILNRIPERDILPYCQEHNIGVIVRGPLAMGILTDKFTGNETFPDGDFRRAWIEDDDQAAQFAQDLETVRQLRPLIGDDRTMAQLALQFVMQGPAVSTVIPGARNEKQARQNAAAGRLPALTKDEIAAIDRIVPPGGGRKIWPA